MTKSSCRWIGLAGLLLMTGCWDQNLLSNSAIQLGFGVDLAENGKIKNTLALVTGEKETRVMSIVGETPRDTKLHANQRLAGNIDSSKNRFVLISEEAAKKGIYPYLDVLYRDPKSALNAKLGIVEGSVENLLKRESKEPTIREFDRIFTSTEQTGSIPVNNVQEAFTIMIDSGQDNLVPFLSKDNQDRIVMGGSAMFHKEYYKGKLTKEDTELLMLMKEKLVKSVPLIIQTGDVPGIRGYATSNATRTNSHLKVKSDKGKVSAIMKLSIDIQLVEYPQTHLDVGDRLHQLETKYEEALTAKAKHVFEKLQKADCDALGIGRKVQAFYPQQWKQMNWEEDYARVQFDPQIKVRIVGNGIIN